MPGACFSADGGDRPEHGREPDADGLLVRARSRRDAATRPARERRLGHEPSSAGQPRIPASAAATPG